ncbi:MAG: DUF4436 family protein [Rhodoblastus sp.]|nr:DUF4436 family protein [Rhodoblastus sp.]
MEDARKDEFLAPAQDAETVVDATEQFESIRSLTATILADPPQRGPQGEAPQAELALARESAEKLVSDFGGDFDEPAPAAAIAVGGAAAVPPAQGWRSRITARFVLIVLTCLAIYALPLTFFVRESREAKMVDPRGADVALRVSIGVTQLHDEKLSVHIKPVSGALVSKSGMLTEDVTVRLDPGTGPVSHTFRANTHLTAWDVTVLADSGDILDYPFDRYRFDFDCEAFANGKPVTIVAGLGSAPHGVRAVLTDIRGQGSEDDISIEIRRSGSVIFLAALSTISLLVVAIAALSVAWQVADKGRRIDFSMMTWVAAFMFVIPAVRNSLPGAPPVGALIDFMLFFWLQALAAIATTTLVVNWTKQRPSA